MRRAIVVGGGVFGVTAALELRARGDDVTLIDPGPLPHPLAESTDISKVVRVDYGGDELYVVMMERALDGWRRWNEAWGAPLFHETGIVFVSARPMEAGAFEHDSFELLTRRGHALERLDATSLRARFPAWSTGRYVEGYYNPSGGWAESGNVVTRLVAMAVDRGVSLLPGAALERISEDGSRVGGVLLCDGSEVDADLVVVAAGSWTPHLLPRLRDHVRSVGQPVFHFAPNDPSAFRAERFPVFTADITRTGYYGFPIHGGVVKIANHGVGRAMHPESGERAVTDDEIDRARAFLRDSIPALAEAPLSSTRVCVYGDTHDEHFWIAPDPDREGLVVAAGGSGHAFKFAPLLGALIADAAEGRVAPRFRWRPEIAADARGEEASRHHH